MIIIYIILSLFATIIGAITGMGGGIIMKPVMDALGDYDAATIGILSSVTVFAMAVVSCIRQNGSKINVSILHVLVISIMSILGGIIGQYIFEILKESTNNDSLIKLIQNFILAIMLISIFIYMMNKEKIKSLGLKNIFFFAFAGIFLGMISSFLGIGGGPLNVSLFILLFNMDIKTAAFSSIITILFAQISKLSVIFFTTGFTSYDLTILPYMVVSGIFGALIGSSIRNKISDKLITLFFNIVQIIIFSLCIMNIIINI